MDNNIRVSSYARTLAFSKLYKFLRLQQLFVNLCLRTFYCGYMARRRRKRGRRRMLRKRTKRRRKKMKRRRKAKERKM